MGNYINKYNMSTTDGENIQDGAPILGGSQEENKYDGDPKLKHTCGKKDKAIPLEKDEKRLLINLCICMIASQTTR